MAHKHAFITYDVNGSAKIRTAAFAYAGFAFVCTRALLDKVQSC